MQSLKVVVVESLSVEKCLCLYMKSKVEVQNYKNITSALKLFLNEVGIKTILF
jgi:hypothetical protein